MSLKIGTWRCNINGVECDLNIGSVNGEGVMTGELKRFIPEGTITVEGIWDETSRKLSFTIPPKPGPIADQYAPAIFEAVVFSTPRNPAPGVDVIWTMSGFLNAAGLGFVFSQGGNARRTTFGWFASITEVA
ncbi:MAG: hypothetical protein H8K03_19645 [Nitrospira sp.]